MKKVIKIIIVAGIILMISTIIIVLKNRKQELDKENKKINQDAIKFKNEYEELNGTVREKDGHIYNNVNISENNPIIYITLEELVNILNSGEGIVFISNPTCPYCRASIPSLLEVARDLKVDKIYYYNTKSKNENYKELTKTLLDKDIIKRNEEENDEWNIPQVLNIKNGEILLSLKGTAYTLENEQTKYDELTKEQKSYIYKAYYTILSKK